MSSSGKVSAPALRRRDLPGPSGLPVTASTLPTVTVGAAGAASTIASAVFVSSVSSSAFNSAKFTCLGTIPTIGTTFPDYNGISSNDGLVNVTSQYDTNQFAVEFFTDASQFDVNLKDTSTVRVLADGAYVYGSDSAYGWKGAAAGSTYNINVNFGSSVLRRITLEFDGVSRFYGINVGPTDSVIPGQQPDMTMVVFGDSFTEPTIKDDTAYPNHMPQHGFPWRLGQMLGIRNVVTSGSGGAGYLQTGPNSRVPFPQRSQNDIGKFKPQICVMHAGLNDSTGIGNGTYTQSQLQSAIEQTMTNVWQVSPGTFFYLSLNGSTAATPNVKLMAAQAAAAAHYPSNSLYLSSLEPQKIYTGSGYVGSATPSGNCGILVGTDGTHPSMAGHKWLAYQLYSAISTSLVN